MRIIRSLIFNILFFATMFFFLFFGMITLFFDEKYAFKVWHYLSASIDFLAQKIVGITYTIEKTEDNPKNAIYAIRHESTWETLVFIHLFNKPIFILKKELLDIPLFGPLAKKVGSIDVDRENGVRALLEAIKRVEKAVSEGHPVIIFPEGTRIPAGEHAEIKRGIALFYKKINCPVVPVVHNSGTFWSKHGFIKNPGNITVKVFKTIMPGLSQEDFLKQLNEDFYNGIEELKKKNEKQ